jgi:hypothetical protein
LEVAVGSGVGGSAVGSGVDRRMIIGIIEFQ